MYRVCPKCGHEREDGGGGPAERCPACGLVYAKWLQSRFRPEPAPAAGPSELSTVGSRLPPGWLADLFLHVPERTASGFFYLRAVVFVGLVVWGVQFIAMDYYKVVGDQRIDLPVPPIGESVMHLVNIPFHEAGHMVFRPFGQLMMYLGGTLGQLLMPLVVLGWFLIKERNTFGAFVGLWWLGQSLMDAAPYINDARKMQIPLIGGGPGREGRAGLHDWHNILRELGLIRHDHAIADAVDAIGVLVMLLAFAWGAAIVYRQYRNLP